MLASDILYPLQDECTTSLYSALTKKLLNDDDIRIIKEQIEAHNDITIGEIREALDQKASYTTVERAVNGLGYTIKKKSLHASERDRARCTGKTYSVEGTIGRG